MNRIERIQKAYNYPDKLTIQNKEYSVKAMGFLERELQEDLEGFKSIDLSSDMTTNALFKDNKKVKAYIKTKQDGIIAGLEEVSMFYRLNGLEVKIYKQDGDRVKKGENIMELEGLTKTLLKLERTGLNLLQRMSGIATKTRILKDKIKGYNTKIAATRKTQIRYLDKKAVILGGGMTHRLGLYDGIMIKDTHLDSLRRQGIKDAIEEAIEKTSKYNENPYLKFIEIEVSSLEEAVRAAKKFQDVIIGAKINYYLESLNTAEAVIMLDNMKPPEIRKVISKLKKEKLYDYVLLEASGMITEKNIKNYAKAGVDVISVGALTHSVKALDISQKIIRQEK